MNRDTESIESYASPHQSIRVEKINGKYSFLLKFFLVTWIPFLTLQSWLILSTVKNNEFRMRGDRFTQTDARVLEGGMKRWHSEDILRLRLELEDKIERSVTGLTQER